MPPPTITHVLETILYVKSMPASVSFYKEVLGLTPFLNTPRMTAFALPPTTLLLFQLGGTARDTSSPSGIIPGHGPTQDILSQLVPESTSATPNLGPNPAGVSAFASTHSTSAMEAMLKQHYCLAVQSASDVDEWDTHLQAQNVSITGRMNWPRNGKSVYFTDPDGHVGEIASRGIWPHY